MENKLKKGKVINDILYNITASFLLTATLQLIAYPVLGNKLTEEKFGIVLTIMGLINVVGALFGTALNNIRLLNQKKYDEIKGDFKPLLKKSILFAVIIMVIINFSFRKNVNILEMIGITIIPILIILRGYISVYYRIDLNYKMLLIHMIVTSIGYILGIMIFLFVFNWTIIFLIGELVSYVFLINTTKHREDIDIKTLNFDILKKNYRQLVIANLIGNIMIYLDRLLITPILGATNVTIYFTASLVGKTLGIVLQPISSIILTYITKFKWNSKKLFWILTIITLSGGIISYIVSIYISPILISILYSETYEIAQKYFGLANLSAILLIMGSLLQPLVLKYCHLSWQSIIQIVYLIIYLFGGIYLMNRYGLYGFCIISIISNLVRLMMLWSIGAIYILKDNKIKSGG